MNPIKKSLIQVAGDMSESKDRVKQKIYHSKNKSFNKRKNTFAIIGAFATICLFLFLTDFLLKEQQSTTNQSLFSEDYFNQMYAITKATSGDFYQDDEELMKRTVYENYENKLAFYTYARSLGYEISTEAIQEKFNAHLSTYDKPDYENYLNDVLKNANMTRANFDDYLKQGVPFDVAQEILADHFIELYPKIDDAIAKSLSEKHALPYFYESYSSEIKEFQEQQNIHARWSHGEGSPNIGRIIAIEDNMFLVKLQADANNKIVDNSYNSTWYPQDETPPLSIGDYVQVFSNNWRSRADYAVADIWDLIVLERMDEETRSETKTLEISDENKLNLRVFLNTLRWEEVEVEMTRIPDYELILDNDSYFIWETPSENFVIQSKEKGYRILPDHLSTEFKELIE